MRSSGEKKEKCTFFQKGRKDPAGENGGQVSSLVEKPVLFLEKRKDHTGREGGKNGGYREGGSP